jgi:hypothetical protein
MTWGVPAMAGGGPGARLGPAFPKLDANQIAYRRGDVRKWLRSRAKEAKR